MKEKTITCIQCESTFTVTATEQKRLLEKGFSLPSRCPDCRKRKSKMIMASTEGHKARGKWERHKRFKDDLDEE